MYEKVEKWFDDIFAKDFPSDVVAIIFNIYEDGENEWSFEVVGTSRFDREDSDWGADEVTDFGTRDEPYEFEEECIWQGIHAEISSYVKLYLEEGKYAGKLKSLQGIGVGFVDAELEVVFPNEQEV